jgi:hypothetical protein
VNFRASAVLVTRYSLGIAAERHFSGARLGCCERIEPCAKSRVSAVSNNSLSFRRPVVWYWPRPILLKSTGSPLNPTVMVFGSPFLSRISLLAFDGHWRVFGVHSSAEPHQANQHSAKRESHFVGSQHTRPGPLKWRPCHSGVTGRAICCAAQVTVTSRPWWNATRVVMLIKVPSGDSPEVVGALSKHVPRSE